MRRRGEEHAPSRQVPSNPATWKPFNSAGQPSGALSGPRRGGAVTRWPAQGAPKRMQNAFRLQADLEHRNRYS